MSDVDVEVTPVEGEAPVGDQIVITVSEQSASYQSTLPPHEIIFWLELMKGMIVKNLLNAEGPEPTA